MNDEIKIENVETESYCDSIKSFKALYMSKINAKVILKEEQYNAKLSIYYIPDSVFFVSATNSGFEIVRIGVFKDSTVYINRVENVVFIVKLMELGFPAPISFEDIEYLVNKQLICNGFDVSGDSSITVNRSINNVVKEIEYSSVNFSLKRFEFFQKKTGEYVVGKQTLTNGIVIYSNYLLGHFMIEGSEGEIEYDREINVDLSINRRKYDIVYL
ncbi:MAG: hypothetical protein WD577_13120 [Bacteroidales bacterium]